MPGIKLTAWVAVFALMGCGAAHDDGEAVEGADGGSPPAAEAGAEALPPLPEWAPTGFACHRVIPVGGCVSRPDGVDPSGWVLEGTVTAAGRGARSEQCGGLSAVGLPFSDFDDSPFATWFTLVDAAGDTHDVVFRAPAPLDVRVGDALTVTARQQSAEALYADGGELLIEDADGLLGFVEYWSAGEGHPDLEAEVGEVLCEIDEPDQLKVTGYQTDVAWLGARAALGWGESARLGDLQVIASGAVSVADPYDVSQEGCHACTFKFGLSAARVRD